MSKDCERIMTKMMAVGMLSKNEQKIPSKHFFDAPRWPQTPSLFTIAIVFKNNRLMVNQQCDKIRQYSATISKF